MVDDGGVSIRGTDDSGIEIEGPNDGGVSIRGTDDSGIEILDEADLARHVRTEAGVKRFHLPIGSLIVDHPDAPHVPLSDLLDVARKGKQRPKKKTPDMLPDGTMSPEARARVEAYGAKMEAERKARWDSLKPGDSIPDTSDHSRAQWLNDAPVGTTIEIRQDTLRRPSPVPGVVTQDVEVTGPRQVWTKTTGQGDPTPHWEYTDASGSTQIAYDAQRLIDNQWGPAKYQLPPSFGGDIDKVLRPRDGDEITYLNKFDSDRPTTMVYVEASGMFQPKNASLQPPYHPSKLLSQVAMGLPDLAIGDPESLRAYQFWAVDADRLDGDFRKGGVDMQKVKDTGIVTTKPFDVPEGWAQSTPREAFSKDPSMAIAYYGRSHRATGLRLFKGPHDEVAVVDDAEAAKNLRSMLSGVHEAMDMVASAPAIRNPQATPRDAKFRSRSIYTTFTVPDNWDDAGNALAFVRMTVPDDIQINPALLNGTFDSEELPPAMRTGAKPFGPMLTRLTSGVSPLSGKLNFWTPAAGKATDNIFTAFLIHELGHVNDGREGDTGDSGIDADPSEIAFWKAHKGISDYGNTNAAEAYAEAFAEWHAEQWLADHGQMATFPPKIEKIAAAYAERYGWK